jgi:hypothetical protein
MAATAVGAILDVDMAMAGSILLLPQVLLLEAEALPLVSIPLKVVAMALLLSSRSLWRSTLEKGIIVS